MVRAATPSVERWMAERRSSVRLWVAPSVALWVAASVVRSVAASVVRWAQVSEEAWAVEGVAE
jgi:hypothetical protein